MGRPGQPTKYKEKYCEEVIDFMAEGKSVVQFAAKIRVSKETVYEWARTIPRFSDAFIEARALCEAHWEQILQDKGTKKKPGSDAILMFYMKNRFRWSEKENEAGNPGAAVAGGAKVVLTLPDNGRSAPEEN